MYNKHTTHAPLPQQILSLIMVRLLYLNKITKCMKRYIKCPRRITCIYHRSVWKCHHSCLLNQVLPILTQASPKKLKTFQEPIHNVSDQPASLSCLCAFCPATILKQYPAFFPLQEMNWLRSKRGKLQPISEAAATQNKDTTQRSWTTQELKKSWA